ncbi:D-serine/D-alanine/glycine:proton symporter (AAT family) [Actinomadura pelletieri DSM 43383]|uniref:D-serine/D-alanine/glycine:proton symporter (AAT family) n=1 Tax=Actinomadura pelletieri DSM 43383 TaxID=1120940 RepID=A0A495Q9Y7_9ACTN|nr:amino acid permease [Actinomadura pelletieri]RKS68124.1 D-serine/D-alanine/glycine:proton symporter (AAT family) [Actinomadura pelletieri DSM 43383]
MVAKLPEGYQRGLGTRQIQMLAIGGTIGTGLFLGAGENIAKAGPSLILMYAVAGVALFLVMRALGELLTYRTAEGGFAGYAREFLGPFWGYATTWTYWIIWVTTGMAELTAAGTYIQTWWPGVEQWQTALVALVVLFVVNLISVKIFGELEFWFAMIKVAAIVMMILVGLGVLAFGFGDAGETARVGNLWGHGGIFPEGYGATIMTLQMVMFAYLGVELVGVTAGEAKDPERNIPRAINALPVRFALFYLGSLVVILSVVPWTAFKGGASPFVLAFDRIGIPGGADIVNFVVLTAALSSCNAGGLYSTSRMLRTAGVNGDGPKVLARLSGRGVPVLTVVISAVVMGVGVVVNAVVPEKAFMYITSVSTGGALAVWTVILVAHMVYRRKVGAKASYRMPWAPYTNWGVLAFFGFVTVTIAWEADTRIALYVMAAWAGVVVAGWGIVRRGSQDVSGAEVAVEAGSSSV